MALGSLIAQELAHAAECNTCRLPHLPLSILEASVQQRPQALDMGTDELAATLNRDAEGDHGALSL